MTRYLMIMLCVLTYSLSFAQAIQLEDFNPISTPTYTMLDATELANEHPTQASFSEEEVPPIHDIYFKRATASAGWTNQPKVAFINSNRAVTALIQKGSGPRGSNGKLKLITWDLIGQSKINRKDDIENNIRPLEIQMVKGMSNDVVVAVRDQLKMVKLMWFTVNAGGVLALKAEKNVGTANNFQLLRSKALGRDYDLTVVLRNLGGRMVISTWDLRLSNTATYSIQRKGERFAGQLKGFKAASAKNFNGIFTAIRRTNNNLKLINWKISQSGTSITRGGDHEAGYTKKIYSVSAIREGACVALSNSEGKPQIISYESSSNANTVTRKKTLYWNDSKSIQLISSPHAGSFLTAAIIGGNQKTKLIGLGMSNKGANLRRIGDREDITTHQLHIDSYNRSGNDALLTAVTDASGNLKLTLWQANLVDH